MPTNSRFLHAPKLLLFAVLSLADLGVTWFLVQTGGGSIYESNPIAAWWLAQFGWAGLLGFKLASVLLVGSLAIVVTRLSPRAGGRLALFACTTVLVVLTYSCCLAHAWAAEPLVYTSGTDLSRIAETSEGLDRKLRDSHKYQLLLNQLIEDVVSERLGVPAAVHVLAASAKGRDPEWIHHLRSFYPDRTPAECLTANLVQATIASRIGDLRQARRVARRLRADYEAAVGASLIEDACTPPALLLPEEDDDSDGSDLPQ